MKSFQTGQRDKVTATDGGPQRGLAHCYGDYTLYTSPVNVYGRAVSLSECIIERSLVTAARWIIRHRDAPNMDGSCV